MHHIKLTKPFKLGKKIIPTGRVCRFDRKSMNRLVSEGDAYYCSEKGFEVPWNEDIAGPKPKKASTKKAQSATKTNK